MLKIRRAQKAAFPPEPKKIDVDPPPPEPEMKVPAPTAVVDDAGSKSNIIPLQIRQGQQQAFEQAARKKFEDEMVVHLRQLAPQHCNAVGEAGLRQLVRTGMERAAKNGLTNRGPVRFYLDLMIMLGSDFDTDPQYPWTAALLKDSTTPDQMVRAERLHEKVMDYSAKVFGQDYVQEKAAVRRAGAVQYEELPLSGAGSVRGIATYLERIFPEKVRYLGASPISGLASRARVLSEQHRLVPERGPVVLAGLMFAFGHGVTTDPQFPWVASTLVKDIQDPAARTERLFRRALTYQRLGEAQQT
jgi:hypothetical protein